MDNDIQEDLEAKHALTIAAATVQVTRRLKELRTACLPGQKVPYEIAFVEWLAGTQSIDTWRDILSELAVLAREMAIEHFESELKEFLKQVLPFAEMISHNQALKQVNE